MPKSTVQLRGGLNTSTDRSMVRPGQMTQCMNFEVTSTGVVRRALGYRRWSGGCAYGPPAFFMWGPADSELIQGTSATGEWGLPGGQFLRNATSTWVDYGRLSPYTGRARLTYHYDFFDKTDNSDWFAQSPLPTTSAQVVTALTGREPIRTERLLATNPGFTINVFNPINQVFGIDSTWPADTLATAAHEIIDRAWPAYWDQIAGQGLAPVTDTGNGGGVQSVPGYHPYGGIAGLTYWRDRLYVVADILSMSFSEGRSAPAVGDVMELQYRTIPVPLVPTDWVDTNWQWTVEKVIVTGGEWSDGTATGVILLVGGVPGAPTNAFPPVLTSPTWNSANGRLLDDGPPIATTLVPGIPFLHNVSGAEGIRRNLTAASDIAEFSVCRYLPPGAEPSIGSTITVAGASPAGYNGAWLVIAKPSFVTDDPTDTRVYFIVPSHPFLGLVVTGSVTVNAVAITAATMTRVGTQATVTLANHLYLSGQSVAIASVTPAQYAGTFVIVVNTANTFTYYPLTDPTGPPATSGTITVTRTSTPFQAMRLLGYVDPIEDGAALWRSTDVYEAPGRNGWERVDLGHEVRFATGTNAFVVVNRISSDAFLDGDVTDGSPAILVTDWANGLTLTNGSAVFSASQVEADDGLPFGFSTVGFLTHPLLTLSDFGFAIPEYSIITGIEIEVNMYSQTLGTSSQCTGLSLKVDNVLYGNRAPAGPLPVLNTTLYALGSSTDNWNAPISPAAVNDPAFGIAFQFVNGDPRIDFVRIRLHYKPYVSTVYFQDPVDAAKTITPASNIAVFSVCRYLPGGAAIGSTITVAGASPAGYNGAWLVIAKPSFVPDDPNDIYSYFIVPNAPLLTNPVTGSVTVDAVPISAATMMRVGVQATVTLADHLYVTGEHVTIAGVTQPQYNGNFQILVNTANTFTYYPLTDPVANPSTAGTITAIRTSVASASAVWYYKDKGNFIPGTAQGVLTIYDVTRPIAVRAGLRIRSAADGGGTLYALTAGAAERVYMQSSKDVTRNNSRYEWLIANFTRSVVFEQMFGVSGAGFAFSFDGKYFIRIRTGLSKSLDRPRHLLDHNFQLGLGYNFGDVAFSDLGYAESFSAVFDGSSPASLNPDFAGGSTTVSVADPVFGLLKLPEQSLAVFCEGSIRRISGSGGVFTEQVVRAGHGIIEYTARNVNGLVVFTDTLGMMRLRPTDLFGQLLPQYVSAPVAQLLSASEMATLSGPRPRPMFAQPFNNKNQYRLYFNDGSYMAMTMVGADLEPQFWVGQYDFVPFCVGIGVHSDQSQVQFAGHVFTANHLLPYGPGPGGAGSTALVYGMEVNPAWPFQLDVSSTWDTDAMPALATFFMGDMGGEGGLHATKRFGVVGLDVRAYGYANFAVSFSTRFGEVVGSRVGPGDFSVTGDALAHSVGSVVGGNYVTTQQYRSSIGSNCSGEWLLMTVESNGTTDYDAGATNAAIRWLRPFELGIAAVYYDMNKNVVASETSTS